MDNARPALIEKAERTHRLSEEELASLLADDAVAEEMAAAADRVRRAFVGDEVHLRGLIEFSSYCRQNCMYCG
ncbi:MAG: [Schwartzia sp.]|nr:[FeFe] hydrogenase H-cluster radical SAM maturase HydE [Schwartzia sp. (in: firmicutes)]